MGCVKATAYAGLLLIFSSPIFGQSSSQSGPVRSPEGHLILQPPKNPDPPHRTNTPYRDIEVTVKDAEDRPIARAAVEFTLPGTGASAVLCPSGTACVAIDRARNAPSTSDKVECVETGSDGIARIKGLRANNMAGNFPIRVKASFGGETTEYANISERNERPPFIVRHKKLLILGAASAAVLITVVLLRPSSPHATIGGVTATGPVGP